MPGRGPQVVVVVGVDGAGRTHRLEAIAAARGPAVLRLPAPPGPAQHLGEQLAEARQRAALVLVDDAHRWDAGSLRLLTAAARDGLDLIMARRPTIEAPELAELDETLSARGEVEVLHPLGRDEVSALVTAVTGRACPTEVGTSLWEASGGMPAVAAALARSLDDGPGPPGVPAALLARMQRRVAVLPGFAAQTARLLALRVGLPDAALAHACGVSEAELGEALRGLRDEGMLLPGTERMIPAVADALLTELPPGQRRRLHDLLAGALAAAGAPAAEVAAQLRAAGARGPRAVHAYLAAGESLRFADPRAALDWFDDARRAGAPGGAAGAAEAAAQLGLAVDTEADAAPGTDTAPGAGRLALVAGALAMAHGRADRAAEHLVTAPDPGPVLAVPALMALGQRDRARSAGNSPAPRALRLFADAALAATDPVEAVAVAIEAAEAAELTPPSAVLPDTPHALGAVLAVTAGDAASATHLLEQGIRQGLGGPAAQPRHRLLLAWTQLRTGRLDAATAGFARLRPDDAGAEPNGRDRMLHAAVAAGLARRRGDLALLRRTWAGVERVLARRTLDLFQLEAAEELAVAAARLRRIRRLDPVLAALEGIVAALAPAPVWEVTLGWLHLQVAVAADDAGAARTAADRIGAAAAPGHRQSAQRLAAPVWADALAGTVEAEAVLAATEALAGAELPWEGSRLAGDAAIRVPDAAAARRLLERARELSSAEPGTPRPEADGPPSGLSEREFEVARLVLAGRTHREIGAQLFIAPKTVEHHVARIRTKLGATTRAEFVAALQGLLGNDPVSP